MMTGYKVSNVSWRCFYGYYDLGADSVADDLAMAVCTKYGSHPVIRRVVGEPMSLTSHWLIHQFPYSPPQEYERSGYVTYPLCVCSLTMLRIEIGEDYVAWTTRPVENRQVARIWRYLMPQSIVSSLWQMYTYLGKQWVDRAQGVIWPKSSDSKTAGSSRFDILEHEATNEASQGSKVRSMEEMRARIEKVKMGSERVEKLLLEAKKRNQKEASTPTASLLPKDLQRVMLWDPADVKGATTVFRRNLARTYKPPGSEGRLRGSFTVKGEVGMTGPEGQAKMAVWAEYHPDYGYTKVFSVLVALLPYTMSPRGGP